MESVNDEDVEEVTAQTPQMPETEEPAEMAEADGMLEVGRLLETAVRLGMAGNSGYSAEDGNGGNCWKERKRRKIGRSVKGLKSVNGA